MWSVSAVKYLKKGNTFKVVHLNIIVRSVLKSCTPLLLIASTVLVYILAYFLFCFVFCFNLSSETGEKLESNSLFCMPNSANIADSDSDILYQYCKVCAKTLEKTFKICFSLIIFVSRIREWQRQLEAAVHWRLSGSSQPLQTLQSGSWPRRGRGHPIQLPQGCSQISGNSTGIFPSFSFSSCLHTRHFFLHRCPPN